MNWNSSSYFSKYRQSFGVKATLKLERNLNLRRQHFDFPSCRSCIGVKEPEAEATTVAVICLLLSRPVIEIFFHSFD